MIFEINYTERLYESGICKIEADSIEEAEKLFMDDYYDYVGPQYVYETDSFDIEINGIREEGEES